MATDLLGTPTTPQEDSILAVYSTLRELLSDPSLPPLAAANLRDALASVSTVVTDLALGFEHLVDLGV